jgi:hypothetical protein
MERHNDLNSVKIAWVGFLGALVTFIVILAMQVLYYSTVVQETEQKVVQSPTTQSDTLLAEQAVKLTRYGWIDRQKQQVTIPIDRAMELVVNDLSAASSEERNNDR